MVAMDSRQPGQLLTLLRRELRAGEQLLWAGQPHPWTSGRRGFVVYLFAVPWTAFALFWEAMALAGWMSERGPQSTIEWGAGIAMPLFGLPFIAIGIAMLSAPWWMAAAARRTIFGVTDQRAIALTLWRRLKVRSVDGRAMGPISRVETRSGLGSLSIETGSHRDSDGDRVTDKFELDAIEDVAKVEELLRRVADRAHQPAAQSA
jgi:hypothetical protein